MSVALSVTAPAFRIHPCSATDPFNNRVQLEWLSDADGNVTEVVDEVDPFDAAESAANAVSVNYNTGGARSLILLYD